MGSVRDGCIRWGGDCQRGRCSFWVNVGHSIVTKGTLLHSCTNVPESIRDVVCGGEWVNQGTGIFDGVHIPPREVDVWGGAVSSHWFEWHF